MRLFAFVGQRYDNRAKHWTESVVELLGRYDMIEDVRVIEGLWRSHNLGTVTVRNHIGKNKSLCTLAYLFIP